MKHVRIVIALLALLAAPASALAALDAIFEGGSSTEVALTVAGLTLNVQDTSQVESVTVDDSSTNLSVVMAPSAHMKIVSSNRRNMTVSNNAFVTSRGCTSSQSELVLDSPTGITSTTITITPESTTCIGGGSGGGGGGGGGGGSSGGGGGGGGSSAPAAAPAPTPTPAPQPAAVAAAVSLPTPPAKPSIVALSVSPVFTRVLKTGSKGEDVKRLQQLLNSDPDTRIAATGPGSLGNETDLFGGLTQKAVQKFQEKHGLVSKGTPETTGFGLVGPATRAKMSEVFSGKAVTPATPAVPAATTGTTATPAVPASVSSSFTRALDVGAKGEDVKRLQQLLNSDPDTRIAQTGTGSPGNETETFGSLTKNAVGKFQEKHGLAKPGDLGYGFVGPKTRAKIESVFGVQSAATVPATPAPTISLPAAPAATPVELEKQVSDLQKLIENLRKQIQGN